MSTFWIYVLVYAVGAFIVPCPLAYWASYADDDLKPNEIVGAALFWPVVVVGVALIIPAAYASYLGDKKRKEAKKK